MSVIHVGTETTLAAIATADISNNDVAYIWLGDYSRKMVFDSTSTKAEDTTNHPYYLRPSDYSTAGVWIEEVGADQPQAWNGSQIRTGAILSLDWDSGTSGMMIDLDNEQINIKDAVFGNAGIQIGWIGSAAKLNVKADADNFLNFDGSKLTWKAANTQLDASGNLIATSATLSGSITATSGAIGGFTLGATTLTATNLILDSSGQRISLGSGNDIIILDADDATYRAWIGHATAASSPFRVSKAGVLTATGANIAGTITGGSLVISDTGAIYSTGKTSYADTDAGFFLGYDTVTTSAYKFNIGDANSFIKWDGSALSMQMASGDFDLYSNLNVKAGGDILCESDATSPGKIRFKTYSASPEYVAFSPEYASDAFYIYPETSEKIDLHIGVRTLLGASVSDRLFEAISISSSTVSYLMATNPLGTVYSHVKTTSIPASSCTVELYSFYTSTSKSAKIKLLSETSGAAIDFDVENETQLQLLDGGLITIDDFWIGLGPSAGRIEFDSQTINEINFLSCNVGIGTSSPITTLHVINGTASGFSDTIYGCAVFERAGTTTSNSHVHVVSGNDATAVLYLGDADNIRKGGIYYSNTYDRLILVANEVQSLCISSSGKVGIGTVAPSANADLTLEGGVLCIKERATPTADTNYGKIYTKSDNKLYFQSGDGTENEIQFV